MDRLAQARAVLQAAESQTGMRPGCAAFPAPAALRPLLPSGIPRGGAIQVTGSRTLVWSLAAAVMGDEGWCVVIGLMDVGWHAAAQVGVDLRRVIYLPKGATVPVLAAAIDGAEAVVVGPNQQLGAGESRSIDGRLRNRGGVLISTSYWPGAIHLDARVTHAVGCDDGAGYVSERILQARRNGAHARLAAGERVRPYRPLAAVS